VEPDDDAALVARALLHQDPEAFGLLVRRYQSAVRDFLRQMTRGDWSLADDLAQETFVRGWQRLAGFRADARFSSWLFGIAFNTFRASFRRAKASPVSFASAVPEHPSPAPAAPPGLRLDLAEALSALGDDERAAVLLCCQQGLSHQEAAEALGWPLGTVKTHVLRGREKLRKLLER
jgi:RNA polymerase sigma-70 factor (ECF subfamily)